MNSPLLLLLSSIVCLLIAAGCIFLARRQEPRPLIGREKWAQENTLDYRPVDRTLHLGFHRGPLTDFDASGMLHIVSGDLGAENLLIFDQRKGTTVIGIRRETASPVVIDLRDTQEGPPAEKDMKHVGDVGHHSLYANHLSTGDLVAGPDLAILAEELPDYFRVVWTEGPWSFAHTNTRLLPAQLDKAIPLVIRFSRQMSVLPPHQQQRVRLYHSE